MPARLTFDHTFEVVIKSRPRYGSASGSAEPQLDRGSLVWYTDGSKMEEGVGAGVYGPGCRLFEGLGHSPTIFQAEIHAINLCAQRCLSKGLKGCQHIYLLRQPSRTKSPKIIRFHIKDYMGLL